MTFVSELKPIELWKHFDEILKIPRGSKNEKAIAAYVIACANRNGLSYSQDEAGNVVVRKPGTTGREDAETVILQGHLDMVNEKNTDVEHDFTRDPLQPQLDGEYLKAKGTTLGSDNGMGVAASLALIDTDSVQHGPLEFLFTVDEETGLTGAGSLGNDFLKGRLLINLDTEEEGAVYVGCAGGAAVDLTLPLEWQDAKAGLLSTRITLRGMKGGHSGVDIHLQRGNAVRLLARALREAAAECRFNLAAVHGGNMHNAIPREAFAFVCAPEGESETCKDQLDAAFSRIRSEFSTVEPDLTWSFDSIETPTAVMTESSKSKALALLDALPHGVMAMSNDIPDLVETSSNLATVRTEEESLKIHVSNRSSVDSALLAQQQRIVSVGILAGAAVKVSEGYPGWQPNLQSRTLKASKKVFESEFGKEPVVKAVHAGLECGIIGQKYPGMDMVSFGPQIEFPHSPDERVRVGSVGEFYRLLCLVLEDLAAS